MSNVMSSSRPILSILIPTRNRAEYLPFAIQSALNIESSAIEIIVSENYSKDDSWSVCESFSDPRLQTVRPPKPLPMHENWEFLLNLSRGKWVTFIGDDDGIMPHCAEHLLWLDINFPQAEAIVSPRAYYFWNGCQKLYGDWSVNFSFCNDHFWGDSKKQLHSALEGKIDYIQLPQMYSGGFQRRSLINRVCASQGGLYFKSATPDAYSALMACLHTYRYLETKIPMTWVGVSPDTNQDPRSTKDRTADFFDQLHEDTLTLHPAIGDVARGGTFLMFLYEAYLSAFPLTSPELLSMEKVQSVIGTSVMQLQKAGRKDLVDKLTSQDWGFEIPLEIEETAIESTKENISRGSDRSEPQSPAQQIIYYSSTSHEKHPNILSCDELVLEAYAQCMHNAWNDSSLSSVLSSFGIESSFTEPSLPEEIGKDVLLLSEQSFLKHTIHYVGIDFNQNYEESIQRLKSFLKQEKLQLVYIKTPTSGPISQGNRDEINDLFEFLNSCNYQIYSTQAGILRVVQFLHDECSAYIAIPSLPDQIKTILLSMRRYLVAKDSILEKYQLSVEDSQHEVERLQSELEKSYTELQQVSQKYQSDVKNHQNEVGRLQVELKKTRAENQEFDKNLTLEKYRSITEIYQNEVERLQSELKKKHNEIQIVRSDFHRSQIDLQEQKNEISELQKRVTVLDSKILLKNENLNTTRDKLRSLKTILKDRESDLEELRQELNAISSSKIWKFRTYWSRLKQFSQGDKK